MSVKVKSNVLLKISGEAISSKTNLFDDLALGNLANQIKKISTNYNVGIVLGGGNIMRGGRSNSKYVDRASRDQIGMLATIINSIALKDALVAIGVKVKLFSLLMLPTVANVYNIDKSRKAFAKNKVVIFAGGTGNPYFSTDSGIALRALENNAKLILMGKNGVDGIYTADPNKQKTAKRINKITYKDAIKQNLEVMDLTAMELLKDSQVKIRIFDCNQKDAYLKALKNQIKYSEVSK